MKINKILYFSSVTFGDEQGCSINELEFCKALFLKFQGNAFFVLDRKNENFVKMDPCFPVKEKCHFYREGRLIDVFSSFRTALSIYRLIQKEGIDLLVTRVFDPPLITFFLMRIFKIRVAIKTAGTTYSPMRQQKLRERLYAAVEKWVRTYVQEHAFTVDAPTPELAILVKADAPRIRNLFVVENSTNLDFFRPRDQWQARQKYGFHRDDIILGFVGATPSEDGAEQMIEIAKNIVQKHPKIKVVIVGDDGKMSALKEVVQKEHLDAFVFFMGRMPYSEMPLMIPTFDIGFSLVPKHILKRNGNSSQKTRQYLACGVPVITVAPGHAFVEENPYLGAIVDPDNIVDIINKTLNLIEQTKHDAQKTQDKIRQYALDNLTISKGIQQRLEFWTALLKD